MIIDGKKLAEQLKTSLQKRAARSSIRPGFAVLLIGDDPASRMYVDLKCRLAQELDFLARPILLPANSTQKRIEHTLAMLNADAAIHGIIIQLPLPPHLSVGDIVCRIDPAKDIDCLTPDNLSRLFLGTPAFVPPTPEAVLRLIRSVEPDVKGKNVVVVGAGFFGRQIAAHLFNHEMIVTIIPDKTGDRAVFVKRADIVVSATGKPGSISGAMVGRKSIVIDVGIAKVKGRVVGDVIFSEVSRKVRAVSPVPGGVGPLTVVLIMENVLKASQLTRTKN